MTSPGVMWNMLGDVWHNGTPPDWGRLTQWPDVTAYEYGKAVAKPGRKMAHLSILRPSIDEALSTLHEIQATVFSVPEGLSTDFVTNR